MYSRHLVDEDEDRYELSVRIVKFSCDAEDIEKATEWSIER